MQAERVLSHSSGFVILAMDHTKLVVVQAYGSRPEADLAKGVLEDAGIQAMVQADTAGGMRKHLAWSGAGLEFGCERKAQPQRGMCSLLRPRVTNALTRTFKPTAIHDHRGAGSPRFST